MEERANACKGPAKICYPYSPTNEHHPTILSPSPGHMTTEDNREQRSNTWVMVVLGIFFWVLVKTITFISRHGLGGPDLVMENELPPRPLIVTSYENREIDHQLGVAELHPPEMTSDASTLGENNSQLDPGSGSQDDALDLQSPESETGPEAPELSPEVPELLARSEAPVQYRFEPGKDLVYEFDIHAELGSQEFTYRGRNTIQGTGIQSAETNSLAEEQVSESTGTGFVIHPDGIVVTCAHVVMGATNIRALIGDSEQTATVIKFDEENDIALLRLNEGTFPHLKFASSDEVRLGQEARAIGYPLTDVLGETVKVTRGEVSGRGGPTGVDGIQIDATINPGNSGGPLVDNSGRVIGITSSLLAGVGVSEVGFAVPSNRVIEVAGQLGVEVEVIEESSEMSTPEVIDLVSPATVLLKVTSGPQGVGIDPPHDLKFSGYCYAPISPTPRLFRSSSNHDEHFNGTMQVNRLGQLLDDSTETRLPFALGKACLVGIEPLPRLVPGNSTSRSLIVIQDWKTERDNFGNDPYGFGSFYSRRTPPWMRLPAPPATKTKAMVGTELTTVALGKRSSDGIDVTKTYSVQFKGDANGEPPIAITGSGKGKFDADEGRMLTMNYKMTVTVNQDNLTARIPIAMNYKLLTKADLDAERLAREKREQARAKAKAAQSEAMGFRSANPSDPDATGEPLYQKVKDAPQTSKLNEFNPDQ